VSGYDGFDAKAPVAQEPDPEVRSIEIEYQRFKYNVLPRLPLDFLRDVTRATAQALRDRDPTASENQDSPIYGAGYDIKSEVDGMIRAVRAMQGSVLTPFGEIREGVGAKDVKEVVTATASLMSMLMKAHEKLLSLDRARLLEQTTISALRKIGGEEVVEAFVKEMTEALENLEL